MNEIRKEKLRILNLVNAINERGIADVSVEFPRKGGTLVWVMFWSRQNITESWTAYNLDDAHAELLDIRHRLEEMYREALAQREEKAA